VRLLIFTLIFFGGLAGGGAFAGDAGTAALLGALGVVMAFAGAWLLYDRVEGRRP
jgi:hypothetical protein